MTLLSTLWGLLNAPSHLAVCCRGEKWGGGRAGDITGDALGYLDQHWAGCDCWGLTGMGMLLGWTHTPPGYFCPWHRGVMMPPSSHTGVQAGRRGCPPVLCTLGTARTCEELQVREGLREDTPALLLHGQRDHQEAISQLGEVLDEVILPAERKRQLQSNDAGHGRAVGLSPGGPRTGGSGGQGTSPGAGALPGDGVCSLPTSQPGCAAL